MTFDEAFVTFGIPAIALATAYAAMRANEWSVRRDRRRPPAE